MKKNLARAIDEPHLHASLASQRTEKIDGLAQQAVQVRRDGLGARLAVKLKNVVYRGRERAQTRLDLADPLAGLRGDFRCIGQKAGKQLKATQRIANFVRQDRGDFRQSLVPARL